MRLSSINDVWQVLLIWSCIDSVRSILTPRYFTAFLKTMSLPPMLADSQFTSLRFEDVPTGITSVLSVLSFNLLLFIQRRTSSIHDWILDCADKNSWGGALFESSVSSAYLWKLQSCERMTSDRGWEYSVNRILPLWFILMLWVSDVNLFECLWVLPSAKSVYSLGWWCCTHKFLLFCHFSQYSRFRLVCSWLSWYFKNYLSDLYEIFCTYCLYNFLWNKLFLALYYS